MALPQKNTISTDGPCYECIFLQSEDKANAPTCEEIEFTTIEFTQRPGCTICGNETQ